MGRSSSTRISLARLAALILVAGVHQRPLLTRGLQVSSLALRRWPNSTRIRRLSSLSASVSNGEKGAPVEWRRVQLESGVEAEVAAAVVVGGTKNPIVFLHGSFHAAWCWTEHYFSFFTSRGHSCFAFSFRGTGGTFAGDGVRRVKIDQHVEDTWAFLNYVQQQTDSNVVKPILVSHSFGGLAVMKLLEEYKAARQQLAGIAVLCSVPPSGNGRMTMRYLRRSLQDSYKITAGLAMKKCITNAELCRQLFFGTAQVSKEDLRRYMSNFGRDTVATIDLTHLSRHLPSAQSQKETGVANFLVESNDALRPKILVAGATQDFIVDQEGVLETARYFGWKDEEGTRDVATGGSTTLAMIDSPHDVMLSSQWRNGATTIFDWMESNGL